MFAAIPCEGALLQLLRGRVNNAPQYTGYWVVTDKQARIDAAGKSAILGTSIAGIKRGLEQHLGTLSQCTMLNALQTYAGGDPRCDGWARDTINPDSPTEGRAGASYVYAWAVLPAPKLIESMLDLDLCRKAIQSSTGIIIDIHNLPGAWRPVGRAPKVIDDKFVVVDHPLGVRVYFDAKRAARLIRLRAKKKDTKTYPWMEHTAHECLTEIVSQYRAVCHIRAISNLYGYGQYRTHGITECFYAIDNYHELAKSLSKLAAVYKRIAPWVRKLAYHRTLVVRRDEGFDRNWLVPTMRVVGKIPADVRTRFEQLRSNTRKSKSRGIAFALWEQHKAEQLGKNKLPNNR